MEPMSYGEMIASHLEEARAQAAIERAARRAAADGSVAWRVWTGRLLVSAGERGRGLCRPGQGRSQAGD